MTKNKKDQKKNGLEIADEAFQLLCRYPGILLYYYTGGLPFVLGLLYFWADMSRTAFAADYCAQASFGLCILYIWMKYWHALFAEKLYSRLNNKPLKKRSLAQTMQLISSQTLIHASSFIILPIAFIITIPFAWIFSFFHNTSVPGLNMDRNLRTTIRESWHNAKLWPRQNHIMVLTLSLFYIVVLLNIGFALFILPYIFKKFMGIESIFTLSGFSFLNTTFIAVACGLTYLLVNPVIKTAYTLRCFYGSSINTGDDLKAKLYFAKKSRGLIAVGLIMVIGFYSFSGYVLADEVDLKQKSLVSSRDLISSESLDSSINDVISQRNFSWRMPREKVEGLQKMPGWIDTFFNWIGKNLKVVFKKIAEWTKKIFDWIEKLFPESTWSQKKETNKSWLRFSLYILVTALVAVLIFILFKTYKNRKAKKSRRIKNIIHKAPDITDDQTMADELPPNQWIVMAKDLLNKGEYRLALRAFYLSTLSYLGKCEIITIEKYKSNLDYEAELKRRAHDNKGLLNLFPGIVIYFDNVWYGRKVVNKNDVLLFAQDQERIMGLADA